MKIISYLFILLLFFLFNSCVSSENTPNDPSENQKIANEVVKYLEGCPAFFMPPVYGTNNGTIKNVSGAVAWTPSGLTGNPAQPETKINYISRLNLATISNQTSWNDYQSIANSGYPGYLIGITQYPSYTYQAGFVCYSLVYNTFKDAGHDIWSNFPINVDVLVSQLTEYTVNNARVGDVVVFNWDNSAATGTWWDHAGVIVDRSASNPNDWLIVSSIGLVEIFNWGAKKTRIHVFGSTNGGEFSNWDPALENWSYAIYGRNFQ